MTQSNVTRHTRVKITWAESVEKTDIRHSPEGLQILELSNANSKTSTFIMLKDAKATFENSKGNWKL